MNFYRVMHYSEIVRLSVRLSVTLVDQDHMPRLEIWKKL